MIVEEKKPENGFIYFHKQHCIKKRRMLLFEISNVSVTKLRFHLMQLTRGLRVGLIAFGNKTKSNCLEGFWRSD